MKIITAISLTSILALQLMWLCNTYILIRNNISEEINQILYTGMEDEAITYNPQNEMFRLLGTKRSFSQNETFFFSHPYPALFRLISHF